MPPVTRSTLPAVSFLTALRVLACVATLGAALPAPAREADCAACDLCRDRPDLATALNERIRAHVAAGHAVEEIARLEGGSSLLSTPIEEWADRQPGAVQPDRRRLKYRGALLPDNRLFTSYAPSVKVNGVCIGTDKLAHLFQQGWEMYRISVIDGRGDRAAERYAQWLEGVEPREAYQEDESYFLRQSTGRRLGYGGLGRTTSGVISAADLAASGAGLRLYKDLAAGRFKAIGDYVDGTLCEERNPNDYTPAMRALVERNGGR